MGTYHTKINCNGLASFLLTDQHLSHSVSDCHPTERERKQKRQETVRGGRRKGLHKASKPLNLLLRLFGLNMCPTLPLCVYIDVCL